MGLSDRQKQAQAALQAAIEEQRQAFLEATGSEGPEVISDWLLVVACVGYNEDGDQTVAYHIALPNDELLDHRAKGLALHTIHLLTHGERVYGEDGRHE